MLTHTDQILGEKLQEMMKSFDDHPLVRKIKEDRIAQTFAGRKEAAGKIKALRKEESEVVPKLEGDVTIAQTELVRYDEERKVILDKIINARRMLIQENQRIQGGIREAEIILLSNYDERLDEEIAWFRDRHEALLRKKPDSQAHKTGSNPLTMMKKFITFSNAPAIKDSLNYCLACIRELEGMKLTPVLDIERIEAMKKAIPASEIMTEFASEKPYPKINTDPRSLLPSDSEMAWKFEKLMEKAKKVLGK